MKIALTATPSVARFAPILWRGRAQAAFELAAELGYDGVELHLRSSDDIEPEAVRRGKLGGDQQRDTRRATMLDCVGECCRLAAAEGVTILLEPLNHYEADDLTTLDQAADMIGELKAPNLKLLADTYHMNIEEVDIAASLRRHAAVLGHVHLVDSNRQVPGHGHMDMRSILQALLATGYQGYVCFEVLPLPDPRRAASGGIQTVREILASLMARS